MHGKKYDHFGTATMEKIFFNKYIFWVRISFRVVVHPWEAWNLFLRGNQGPSVTNWRLMRESVHRNEVMGISKGEASYLPHRTNSRVTFLDQVQGDRIQWKIM